MNEPQQVETRQEVGKVLSPQTITPAQMLAIAVEQDASMEKLEKLMDLQERWEAKEAEKSFNVSMAAFRANCPSIERTAKGQSGKFAPLYEATDAIREPLASSGLSYRWRTEQPKGLLRVTCVVTHIHGHSEETSLESVLDDSGNKNAVQSIGSTTAYLERYTLFAALGLAQKGMDDDGDGSDPENTIPKMFERLIQHQHVLRDNINSVQYIKESLTNKDWDSADEAWNELEESEQRALWVATSKGGIFTTKERELIKGKGRDES